MEQDPPVSDRKATESGEKQEELPRVIGIPATVLHSPCGSLDLTDTVIHSDCYILPAFSDRSSLEIVS